MRALAHRVIARAGRNYAAGESLDDAKRLVATLGERGYGVTLGYWNQDDETADAVISQYRGAITYLSGIGGDSYLSIKTPAFGSDQTVHETLVGYAAQMHVPLHLDSLAYESADQVINLLSAGPTRRTNGLGCSLPGRWQRSLQDADLAARLGVVPRIVKGQWSDPTHPDIDPREGFIAVARRLAGNVPLVRVATHDPVLLRESVEILQKTNTSCEVELLYGLPANRAVQVARDLDVPVRVYVPYGHAWIPYALNNLKRNPKALWWLFKDALLGPYNKAFPARPART
jgi:proline dehydrogenase